MPDDINKRLTYDLVRGGAASHPALQLALGVFDSVLRGIRSDDRWAWCEEQGNMTFILFPPLN